MATRSNIFGTPSPRMWIRSVVKPIANSLAFVDIMNS